MCVVIYGKSLYSGNISVRHQYFEALLQYLDEISSVKGSDKSCECCGFVSHIETRCAATGTEWVWCYF